MQKCIVTFSSGDYDRVLSFLLKREAVINDRNPEKRQLVVETTQEVLDEMSDRAICDQGIGIIDAK